MNTHEAVVWVCSLFCCSRDDYQLLHRGLLDIFMYNDQFTVGILPVLQVERQKNKKKAVRSFDHTAFSYARSTNPDFKQEVHTYIFLGAPFTSTLTDLTFDFHILLERL